MAQADLRGMSRKTIELIKAETRRLEAMGVVLGMLGLKVFETKQSGRPRVHKTRADKQRDYRHRKKAKVLNVVKPRTSVLPNL